MNKISGVFEGFSDASTFIPEVVQQVLRMKGRQQYDIDIIKDATTTLRKNGFAGDGESHIEDSMQIILEPGRERRLLTAERDGLRIERDGFFPQATEAAALANFSCPKDQVIPSLVQIATNLSTQVKNAQNASNNMVADHAEEVRLLKLAVEDEKKTASDCRSETHRPKAEMKGLEEEIVHLSGLLAPDSSLEAPDGRSTSGEVAENNKPDCWAFREGSDLVVEEEKKSSWWWPGWSILWGNTFS